MVKKKRTDLEHYYKGRGGYIPVYLSVLNSKEFKALSHKAQILLLRMQHIEFPNRNGHIGLSESNAAKLLMCAKETASKALDELQKTGFIERCYNGDFTRGMASEWRITYLNYKGREPTHDWKTESQH